jgi:hypothetical protein
LAALGCHAQNGAIPAFQPDRVLLPNGGHAPLSPGLVLSLYGQDLGPAVGCVGQTVPTELCGVKLLVAGRAAGLLYVQQKQINFEVPREVPLHGTGDLRVIFDGRSSLPVSLPFGLDSTSVALENSSAVGMPVWLKIRSPYGSDGGLRYPIGIHPADFGCYEVEVRREGKALPRIAGLPSQAFNGLVAIGNPCGSIGLPKEPQHTGRLPLHLQYRFDRPGIYEVRFTTRRPLDAAAAGADWTPIEIQPAPPQQRARWLAETAPPSDVVEVLTDYLPAILGIPDDQSLIAVENYLYHSDRLVRDYAMFGLTYWPAQQANDSVWNLMRASGPSDAIITFLTRSPDFASAHADSIVEAAIPYLTSSSPVLLRGAVFALSRSPVSASLRNHAEDALIQAADHMIQTADTQTLTDYAAALGQVSDHRAGEVLWKLVRRNVEQAGIALTWRKVPADLETLLNQSEFTRVKLECAKQLMLAGHASGFRFAAGAMETSIHPHGQELIDFVRFTLPGNQDSDDAAILRYVKSRAAR